MMLTPAVRRYLLVLAGLAAAILACARAEVPFVALTPQFATPLAVAVSLTDTPPATTPPAAPPTNEPAPTAYPGPAEQPTATEAAQQLPTETPVLQPTALPTDTPPATATPEPPTATTAPTATSTSTPTQPAGPQPIPGDAQLIQTFTASADSGIVLGRLADLADTRPETWASLRGGSGIWRLDLGDAQNVAGVKLYAQRDGADPTTLLKIEVSADAQTWTTVFTGAGNCGVPNCQTLTQLEFSDFGWTPTSAQFIRIYGGPFKFALGEIQVAVAP